MAARGRLIVANPGLGCAWLLNQRAEPELVGSSRLRTTSSAALKPLAVARPGYRDCVTANVLPAMVRVPMRGRGRPGKGATE